MQRTLALLTVVLLIVVGGCSGLGGSGGQPTPATESQPTQPESSSPSSPNQTATPLVGETTPTGTTTLDDTHPYTEDGAVNHRRLVQAHITSLESAGDFTLASNRTAHYLANDSLAVRTIRVRRMALGKPAALFHQRQVQPDGTRTRALYRTDSRSCSRQTKQGQTPSVQCGESSTSAQRLLGYTVEATSLETISSLQFQPDGTATKGGQPLYRYRATSLQTPPEGAEGLGENVTLQSATLLVSADGQIVRYEVTYRRTARGTQYRITDVYRTWNRGTTTVTTPAWAS